MPKESQHKLTYREITESTVGEDSLFGDRTIEDKVLRILRENESFDLDNLKKELESFLDYSATAMYHTTYLQNKAILFFVLQDRKNAKVVLEKNPDKFMTVANQALKAAMESEAPKILLEILTTSPISRIELQEFTEWYFGQNSDPLCYYMLNHRKEIGNCKTFLRNYRYNEAFQKNIQKRLTLEKLIYFVRKSNSASSLIDKLKKIEDVPKKSVMLLAKYIIGNSRGRNKKEALIMQMEKCKDVESFIEIATIINEAIALAPTNYLQKKAIQFFVTNDRKKSKQSFEKNMGQLLTHADKALKTAKESEGPKILAEILEDNRISESDLRAFVNWYFRQNSDALYYYILNHGKEIKNCKVFLKKYKSDRKFQKTITKRWPLEKLAYYVKQSDEMIVLIARLYKIRGVRKKDVDLLAGYIMENSKHRGKKAIISEIEECENINDFVENVKIITEAKVRFDPDYLQIKAVHLFVIKDTKKAKEILEKTPDQFLKSAAEVFNNAKENQGPKILSEILQSRPVCETKLKDFLKWYFGDHVNDAVFYHLLNNSEKTTRCKVFLKDYKMSKIFKQNINSRLSIEKLIYYIRQNDNNSYALIQQLSNIPKISKRAALILVKYIIKNLDNDTKKRALLLDIENSKNIQSFIDKVKLEVIITAFRKESFIKRKAIRFYATRQPQKAGMIFYKRRAIFVDQAMRAFNAAKEIEGPKIFFEILEDKPIDEKKLWKFTQWYFKKNREAVFYYILNNSREIRGCRTFLEDYKENKPLQNNIKSRLNLEKLIFFVKENSRYKNQLIGKFKRIPDIPAESRELLANYIIDNSRNNQKKKNLLYQIDNCKNIQSLIASIKKHNIELYKSDRHKIPEILISMIMKDVDRRQLAFFLKRNIEKETMTAVISSITDETLNREEKEGLAVDFLVDYITNRISNKQEKTRLIEDLKASENLEQFYNKKNIIERGFLESLVAYLLRTTTIFKVEIFEYTDTGNSQDVDLEREEKLFRYLGKIHKEGKITELLVHENMEAFLKYVAEHDYKYIPHKTFEKEMTTPLNGQEITETDKKITTTTRSLSIGSVTINMI